MTPRKITSLITLLLNEKADLEIANSTDQNYDFNISCTSGAFSDSLLANLRNLGFYCVPTTTNNIAIYDINNAE